MTFPGGRRSPRTNHVRPFPVGLLVRDRLDGQRVRIGTVHRREGADPYYTVILKDGRSRTAAHYFLERAHPVVGENIG